MKFSRLLRPLSVEDQLYIVRRNLLKSISQQLALVQINTYEELESYCRLLARNSPRPSVVSQIERPRRLVQQLSPVQEQAAPAPKRNPQVHSDRTSGVGNNSARNQLQCWNCTELGHAAINCRKAKRLYCYGCGAPNVTRFTCNKCTSVRPSPPTPGNQEGDCKEGAAASVNRRPPGISQGAIPKEKPQV